MDAAESRTTASYDEKKAASRDDSLAGAEVVAAGTAVDVAVGLVVDHVDDEEVSTEESRKLRRKLDWHLLPIIYTLYMLQFIDKSTLGASAILGILKDSHLSQNQFNTCASAFYIGYLLFQWPQALALQRFPVAKWVTINIFFWAIILGLMPLSKSFGSMFALRFLLGASEGAITPGILIIISMFYTRLEIAQRLGWTFQCNGAAQVISGFISFGVAHIKPTAKPDQWQWLMITTAILTLICGSIFLAFFPDNPTTARFLSHEEKIRVVKRNKRNQNGIETKVWKREQFIEALTDPKTWLFFMFALVSNLQNGLGAQYSIILKGFGFTTLQTTLLNIPSGLAQILGITSGVWLLTKFPNSRAYLAIIYFMPSALGAILLMTLPLHNKVGLLSAFYVVGFGGAPSFSLVVSWVASTCGGHTKRVTTNGIFFAGYALGQAVCTQFWLAKYKPRDLIPWGICLASYVGDWILIISLRYYLNAENKRRDAMQGVSHEKDLEGPKSDDPNDEYGYIEVAGDNGTLVKRKVEKGLLDLTDRENLSFRYVL